MRIARSGLRGARTDVRCRRLHGSTTARRAWQCRAEPGSTRSAATPGLRPEALVGDGCCPVEGGGTSADTGAAFQGYSCERINSVVWKRRRRSVGSARGGHTVPLRKHVEEMRDLYAAEIAAVRAAGEEPSPLLLESWEKYDAAARSDEPGQVFTAAPTLRTEPDAEDSTSTVQG